MSSKLPHFTVSQISTYIRKLFTDDFILRAVAVEGEISNLKYHSSGHVYFTLKDSGSTLNCILFAGNRQHANFEMKDGMKIVAAGSISVYEKGGSYQFYVKAARPAGMGDLYREFERLKNKMLEMGLFDAMYKKPIPHYAFRVGVVTAPTGAAIQDIIQISHRRNPFVQLILYPALVQGAGAAASIVKGIQTLDGMGLDVIIVGRGGGSLEDLWAFNEEAVARAIFDADTPIISAVGHETDTSIADYVADLRAPTPSAAAELAVFDLEEFKRELLHRRQKLAHARERNFRSVELRLHQYYERVCRQNPKLRVQQLKQQRDGVKKRLQECMNAAITEKRSGLSERKALLKMRLDASDTLAHRRLELAAARLEGLSPLKRIAGGYAYIETENKSSVRSVDQIQPGDRLNLYLHDGRISAEAKEIEHGTNKRNDH